VFGVTLDQSVDLRSTVGRRAKKIFGEAALAAVEMANLRRTVVGRSSLAVGKKTVGSQLSPVSKKRKPKLSPRSKKRSR